MRQCPYSPGTPRNESVSQTPRGQERDQSDDANEATSRHGGECLDYFAHDPTTPTRETASTAPPIHRRAAN